MALAVIRACTLHPNPDGSMPLMRVKAIWDAAYEAGDTTRAFSFHRFAAIRNMLSDMGLLEWEDDDLPVRQGVPVEGEREADGDDGVGVE